MQASCPLQLLPGGWLPPPTQWPSSQSPAPLICTCSCNREECRLNLQICSRVTDPRVKRTIRPNNFTAMYSRRVRKSEVLLQGFIEGGGPGISPPPPPPPNLSFPHPRIWRNFFFNMRVEFCLNMNLLGEGKVL